MTAPAGSPTAVVAAGDEETRVLLRSLLRLHQVRVDGEARGVSYALDILRRVRPKLLVVDTVLEDGTWPDLLLRARSLSPQLRFILVAAEAPDGRAVPGAPTPDAVLIRPFRIRAFSDALGPFGPGGPTPSS